MNIIEQLFSLQDLKYKAFTSSLIPTLSDDVIIGVRTPFVKKLAKRLGVSEAKAFLSSLPHIYYEENNLHAFIIAQIRDYDECIAWLDLFLPYVDNWATCDSLRPVCFKTNHNRLLADIKRWLASKHLYTVRFGIEMLMAHFLDDDFSPDLLRLVACIKTDEYYLNMMIAWYFATALAKQYDAALSFVQSGCLGTWVTNKTIQKAVESYRITKEHKAYLRTLRRK